MLKGPVSGNHTFLQSETDLTRIPGSVHFKYFHCSNTEIRKSKANLVLISEEVKHTMATHKLAMVSNIIIIGIEINFVCGPSHRNNCPFLSIFINI